MELNNGILLLSDPFLKDPNFQRSVVFICEYNSSGSFGLVVNRQIPFTLEELVEQAEGLKIPMYEGGPVEKTAVHFLHNKPGLVEESVPINEDICWGGNFAQVVDLLKTGQMEQKDIRFFVGYSGWEAGQLEAELAEKSWITAPANPELVFYTRTELIWKKALNALGGEYALMGNYPSDPQLN